MCVCVCVCVHCVYGCESVYVWGDELVYVYVVMSGCPPLPLLLVVVSVALPLKSDTIYKDKVLMGVVYRC